MNMCYCGKKLHYLDEEMEKCITDLINQKGQFIEVTDMINKKTYKVDRHYMALHGLKRSDLDKFEEV